MTDLMWFALYFLVGYIQAIFVARTDKYLQEVSFVITAMTTWPAISLILILVGFVKLSNFLMGVKND